MLLCQPKSEREDRHFHEIYQFPKEDNQLFSGSRSKFLIGTDVSELFIVLTL